MTLQILRDFGEIRNYPEKLGGKAPIWCRAPLFYLCTKTLIVL
jgi:hypothetical protein